MKRRFAASLALVLGLAITAAAAATAAPETVERRLAMMGTTLVMTIEAGDRSAALAASEVAVRALAAAEERLSTWRDDSELARLNASRPGSWQDLSPALAAELAAAERCWGDTRGAFDPAIGALVRAWGLRSGGRQPSAAELDAALGASGFDQLDVEGSRALRRSTDVILEEGGFGKGAGLAAAVRALATDGRAGGALLDLGGQIAVHGGGHAWEVAVADPARRSVQAGVLTIDRGSIATSGNSERGVEVGGKRLGHLLDPATGRPATDFGSLTVWAEDPLRADCLSTGLYAMGPDAALAWAARQPDVEVLILEPAEEGLLARATPGIAARFTPLAPGLELEVARADDLK